MVAPKGCFSCCRSGVIMSIARNAAAAAQAYCDATASKSAVVANVPRPDHRSIMPEYHLYQVDHIRQIKKGCGITANCLDDAAAFDFAKLFFRRGTQVEVWSGPGW